LLYYFYTMINITNTDPEVAALARRCW
jgi:hypothetical protein